MKLSLLEQETILLYNQAEATAEVYTHDPKLIQKLERLAEKYPEQIMKKDDLHYIVPKRCVSVREPYSANRRKAASERAKAAGYVPPHSQGTLTQNEPIAVPIFVAAFYGLRRSEALGLRWSSIDLQNGWIHIDTTVVKEKIGENVVTTVRENTTKTEYSRRDLPLCAYTHQYFMNLRSRQLAQMQMCGASYDQRYLDFVCVDQMGTLLQPDFVSQKFQQLLQKWGLRPIRFHDLRHSCATIMLYLGYTMKDIQTWLGHSNYAFTANTYVHASHEEHQKMAEALSEKLPELMIGAGA